MCPCVCIGHFYLLASSGFVVVVVVANILMDSWEHRNSGCEYSVSELWCECISSTWFTLWSAVMKGLHCLNRLLFSSAPDWEWKVFSPLPTESDSRSCTYLSNALSLPSHDHDASRVPVKVVVSPFLLNRLWQCYAESICQWIFRQHPSGVVLQFWRGPSTSHGASLQGQLLEPGEFPFIFPGPEVLHCLSWTNDQTSRCDA